MKQVQKNAVFLSVLSALTVALGLYAYFGVMKKEEKEIQKKESLQRLISMGEDASNAVDGGIPGFDFTVLIVEAKGDTTRLEKVGSEWRIVKPESVPADKSAVTQLLGQLQSAKSNSTIEERPSEQDLSRYGLKAPRVSLTAVVSAPAQKREFKFQCGIENTFDGNVYLHREGDPRVYAADGSLKQAIEKSFFDLRDKNILRFDENTLVKFEVTGPKHTFTLARANPAAPWAIQKPALGEADDDAIRTMLSGLQAQQALSFPKDSPEFRKQIDWGHAEITIKLTLTGNKTIDLKVATIKKDGSEKTFLLRREGPTVFLSEVAQPAFTSLDKDPADLRNRRVLSFKAEDVTEIHIRPQGAGKSQQEIKLVKTSVPDTGVQEVWEVTEPMRFRVPPSRIPSLLWSLGNLKAKNVTDEKPKSLSSYGLEDDAQRYTLLNKSGQILGTLTTGKTTQSAENSTYVRGDKAIVYEVEGTRLNDLPKSIDDLSERKPDGGITQPP